MQAAIDSAKRTFEIDPSEEIKILKGQLNVEKNGLPEFWTLIKQTKITTKNREERNEKKREYRAKLNEKVNVDLVCPMNNMQSLETKRKPKEKLINTFDLVVPQEPGKENKKYVAMEKLIRDYNLEKVSTMRNQDHSEDRSSHYLYLLEDFDKMCEQIRREFKGGAIKSFFYWALDRYMNPGSDSSERLLKNVSCMLNALYNADPKKFLECFKKQN